MTFKRSDLKISVGDKYHPQQQQQHQQHQQPTNALTNTDTEENPQTPLNTNQDPFVNIATYGNQGYRNMHLNPDPYSNQQQQYSNRNFNISRTDSSTPANPTLLVETPFTPTFAALPYLSSSTMGHNLSTTSLTSLMSLDGPASTLDQEIDSDMDVHWRPAQDDLLLAVFYAIRDDPTTAPWAGTVPPSGIVGKVARECVKRGNLLQQQQHQQSFTNNYNFYDSEPFTWNHSLSGCRKRLIKLCNSSAKPNRYNRLGGPNQGSTNNKFNYGKLQGSGNSNNTSTTDLDAPHSSIVSNGIITGGGISMNRTFSISSCSSITSSIPDTPTLTGFGNASFVNRNFSGLNLAISGLSSASKSNSTNQNDSNSLDKGLLASPGFQDTTITNSSNIESWLITNTDKVGAHSPGTRIGILAEADSNSGFFENEFELIPPPSLQSHSIHLQGDKQNFKNNTNKSTTTKADKYNATTPPPAGTFNNISSPIAVMSTLSLDENNQNDNDNIPGTHYTPPPIILHYDTIKDEANKDDESCSKPNSPTARRQYNGHYAIYYNNNSSANSDADIGKTQHPVLAQSAAPLAPPAPIITSNRTKNSGNLSFSPANSKLTPLPMGVSGFIFDDRSLKSPFSEIHPDTKFSQLQAPQQLSSAATAVTTTAATGITTATMGASKGEPELGNAPVNGGNNTNSSNNAEANIMNWRKRESLRLKRGLT